MPRSQISAHQIRQTARFLSLLCRPADFGSAGQEARTEACRRMAPSRALDVRIRGETGHATFAHRQISAWRPSDSRCICCPSAFLERQSRPDAAMRLLRSTTSLLATFLVRMHQIHCPAHLHWPCAMPRPAPPLLRGSARMDRTCAAPD